jgi:hypothetical protein
MNSRVPSRTLCYLLETVPACPLPQKDWATLLRTCHRHRYLLVTKHFATKHLLPLFQCLQKLPCWNPLVISFCSSLGSTFLLIERTKIEPRAFAGHQYIIVSWQRTHTSVAIWLHWRAGSTIPGRFFRDLTGAIAIAKEPRLHKRTKHIKRRFNSIRAYVKDGDIEICKVHTYLNLADPLTKPLMTRKRTGFNCSPFDK